MNLTELEMDMVVDASVLSQRPSSRRLCIADNLEWLQAMHWAHFIEPVPPTKCKKFPI